jgi:serine protease AprX
VLDANGKGTDSAAITAIQWAIQNKAKYGINILNMSLGRPIQTSYKTDPLCQAVEQAWHAGLLVVVAAGNDGRNNTNGTRGYLTINAPANDPLVLTVGTMKSANSTSRSDDAIASYSAKGPAIIDWVVKPDIVAPGNQIASQVPTTCTLKSAYPANLVKQGEFKSGGGTTPSDRFFRLSGTSMSAAVVSGAAALLIQRIGTATYTPDLVKARLMRTSTKTFPVSSVATDPLSGSQCVSFLDLFNVGAGYLDSWSAINDSTPVSGNTQSPTLTLGYANSQYYIQMVMPSGATWSTASGVTWGTGMVWGTSVVNASGIVASSGVPAG